jgi:uncharacterized protein YndB with AHSA1/START domain
MDIASQLDAIQREVERTPATDDAGERVSVLMRRTYDTPIQDVWDALTQPDRIQRWFMPITGDLRPGGSFQLEGNASGDILTCDAPTLLRVTFGDATSIVELRLISESESDTVLELEHTVPIEMAQSGAGALYVGPGWDGALLGLGLYLSGEAVGDPGEAANSPEALEFSKGSVDAWVAVVEDSGTATSEELAAAIEVTRAQFAPEQPT